MLLNFECIWENPDKYIENLKRYKALLTPDFSMYADMALSLQIYNTFRNRWCGVYLESKGIPVIPTVSWGDKNTFDFCFEGIENGSTVTVSTYMVSEHNNRADQKEFFMAGYNELFSRIEPKNIICYNTPFPEMDGNIIFVDYDLSSWQPSQNKPQGQRFVGKPSEIKEEIKPNGKRFEIISDFKWCIKYHGEVDFEWKEKRYSITHRTFGISISEANKQETEKIRKDADEVLEYMVGEDRLRDVITKITVWNRSI